MVRIVTIERHILEQQKNFPQATGIFSYLLYDIALAAKLLLDRAGHATRVVSVPCFELFEKQSPQYQAETIGRAPVRIAVEAAIRMGWDRFIGADGIFIGMTGFGASAPAGDLYKHFGITADAAVAAVRQNEMEPLSVH